MKTLKESLRFYKVKNAKNEFLCALCAAPRQMKYTRNLTLRNYFQLTLLATTVSYFLYPLFGSKTFFLIFILWPIAELSNKILYRGELPCPYCGFDATWYKRDIKIARKKIVEFWEKNNSSQKKENDIEPVVAQGKINNINLESESETSGTP